MDRDAQAPQWPPGPTVEDAPDNATDQPMADHNATSANTAANNDTANGNPDKAASDVNVPNNDNTASDSNGAPAGGNPEAETGADDSTTAAPPLDRIQIVVKDQGGNQTGFQVKANTKMSKVMNHYADRIGRAPSTLRYFFEGERILPDNTPATLDMHDNDIIECMTEQIGGGRSSQPKSLTRSVFKAGNANAEALYELMSATGSNKARISANVSRLKNGTVKLSTTVVTYLSPDMTFAKPRSKAISGGGSGRVIKSSHSNNRTLKLTFSGDGRKLPPVDLLIKPNASLGPYMDLYSETCEKKAYTTLRFYFDGDEISSNQTPSELGMVSGDDVLVTREYI